MKGYYNDPERTAEVFTEDGWLKTGDIGEFDENGYLHILGLRKNLIILPNGENISPEELENIFLSKDEIKDCAVYEDALRGRPLMAITIQPEESFCEGKDEKDILTYFKTLVKDTCNQLPSYKAITKTVVTYEAIEHKTGDRLYNIEW